MLSNELLWALMLLANFAGVLITYKYFGRMGLFFWVPVSVMIANIQVLKTVSLFGYVSTLGNIMYAGSFLITDILSENYGKDDARKAVILGFLSMIAMTGFMQLAILFTPNESDFAQSHLSSIFGLMPRIAGASLVAYLISQSHDIWAYQWWRSKFPNTRFIWVRNNLSTMVSQFIDSLVFTFGAFWGVMDQSIIWEIFWTTYLFKWVVAAIDTPCIYLAAHMKQKNAVIEA